MSDIEWGAESGAGMIPPNVIYGRGIDGVSPWAVGVFKNPVSADELRALLDPTEDDDS